MAAEAAVAIALLVIVSVLGRPATPAAQPPGRAWADTARPRIGALLSDIARVGPAGPTAADTTRLRRDLDAARRLPVAPQPAWADTWTRALNDIEAATPPGRFPPPPGAGPAASAELTAAGEALLYLSQSLPAVTDPIPGRGGS